MPESRVRYCFITLAIYAPAIRRPLCAPPFTLMLHAMPQVIDICHCCRYATRAHSRLRAPRDEARRAYKKSRARCCHAPLMMRCAGYDGFRHAVTPARDTPPMAAWRAPPRECQRYDGALLRHAADTLARRRFAASALSHMPRQHVITLAATRRLISCCRRRVACHAAAAARRACSPTPRQRRQRNDKRCAGNIVVYRRYMKGMPPYAAARLSFRHSLSSPHSITCR